VVRFSAHLRKRDHAEKIAYNGHMPSVEPLRACRSALIQRFGELSPHIAVDAKGYVREPSENLIEGVELAQFEADLRQGDGNELENKFRAIHSSSALAVNAFAPFKDDPGALRLNSVGGYAKPEFERKCPHELVGRRPPNLDVLAEGPNGIVAVESKCLEPLSPHIAKFAPAYLTGIKAGNTWFKEMRRLVDESRAYCWLDAAQLVKHAFGLARTFPSRPVTLLYVFWEPANPEAYSSFAEHRAEVARFTDSVKGGGPKFVAMSYPELWDTWDEQLGPVWLRRHVSRLRARYGVAV